MSDEQTPETDQQPETGDEAPKLPTTQEELNRIIGERLARERQKFADYDDLQSKAARAAELETELATVKAEALRTSVAAAKGVPAATLTGTTKEELEASADALIAWRDQNTPKTKVPAPSGLRSGASGSADQLSPKEAAAAALRAMRAGN